MIINLDVNVFNVIRFSIISLVLIPLLEKSFSAMMRLSARESLIKGKVIRWEESRLGHFSLFGKYYDTKGRIALYAAGCLMVAASLMLEFSFDSISIQTYEERNVFALEGAEWVRHLNEQNLSSLVGQPILSRVNSARSEKMFPRENFEYGDEATDRQRRKMVNVEGLGDISLGYLQFKLEFPETIEVLTTSEDMATTTWQGGSFWTRVVGFLDMRDGSGGEDHFSRGSFELKVVNGSESDMLLVHGSRLVFTASSNDYACFNFNGNAANTACIVIVGRNLYLTKSDSELEKSGEALMPVLLNVESEAKIDMPAKDIVIISHLDSRFRDIVQSEYSEFIEVNSIWRLNGAATVLAAVMSGVVIQNYERQTVLECLSGKETRPTVNVGIASAAIGVLISLLMVSTAAIVVFARRAASKKFFNEDGDVMNVSAIRVGDDFSYAVDLLTSHEVGDWCCYSPRNSKTGVVVETGMKGHQHVRLGQISQPVSMPLRGRRDNTCEDKRKKIDRREAAMM